MVVKQVKGARRQQAVGGAGNPHHPPSYMTIHNLTKVQRDIAELLDLMDEDDELEGWVEDKVSQTKTHIQDVKNYLDSPESEDHQIPAMAWPKPHDAWKKLRSGKLATPTEFEGHEKVWKRIAKRLGFDYGGGVTQKAPVIGGRKRYHHRPLTTWRLPGKVGHLTLTTDPMEAKSWNRLKGKRHPAMPRVKDVFEIKLTGGDKYWAIHHEALTWPPKTDWYVFIDTFFRWRAMSKDALKPAKPSDLKEFLEWVLIPEEADAKAQKRRRQEAIIPFKMKKKRDTKIEQARKVIWEDPGLQQKIKWAKSTLKFLKSNNIKHADLDPSNLGKTPKGRTVVTNIAESRSRGKNIGRIGRVAAKVSAAGAPNSESALPRKRISDSPFGPGIVPDILQTVQACHSLLNPDAPVVTSVHMLSGSGRKTFGLIHLDRHMRIAVLEAAYGLGLPPSSVAKGLKRLKGFADFHGEKAWKIYREVSKKLGSKTGEVSAAMTTTPKRRPAINFQKLSASLSGREMVEALSNLLDDAHAVSATVQQSPARVALARPIYKDQDARLAVFLASNGIPLAATSDSIRASATKGLRKLRNSVPKMGRQGGELFNATLKVLKTPEPASEVFALDQRIAVAKTLLHAADALDGSVTSAASAADVKKKVHFYIEKYLEFVKMGGPTSAKQQIEVSLRDIGRIAEFGWDEESIDDYLMKKEFKGNWTQKNMATLHKRITTGLKNPEKALGRKPVKKLTKKQTDKLIEQTFYKKGVGYGVQINIMDIGKVFAAGRQALMDDPTGATLEKALKDILKVLRYN